MTEFYDTLETRHAEERERALLAALPRQIAHAKQNAPGYARILHDVDPQAITSRAALARIPMTRKANLGALQAALPPLGGLNATPRAGLAKIFVSQGPIYEPEGRGCDWWRTARTLHAAGFRAGDLVVNTFAYHCTPAGSMFERGATTCGCTVIPAGTGNTEMQVATIAALQANAYVGTPSFLQRLIDRAAELKIDVSCLQKALVSAEYLPSALRGAMADRGLSVMQCYATADLGLVAYESRRPDGELCDGMILDEGVVLEIVRPGTGEPVADGEVGEVVITSFNIDYPLIRFATGDLSAVLPGRSPCGRTNVRIRGWLGRADQSTKVRGLFVHPSHVHDVIQRHPSIKRARLIVDQSEGQDRMTLHCELDPAPQGPADTIVASLREVTKLRGEVVFRKVGELPDDGRIIDDVRKYE